MKKKYMTPAIITMDIETTLLLNTSMNKYSSERVDGNQALSRESEWDDD